MGAGTTALEPDQFFEKLVLPKEESKPPPPKTQPFFAQLEDDGTGPYAPGNVQSIATASEPINFINGGATSAIEDANISVSNFAATKMSPQELREIREYFNRKVFIAAQIEKPYFSDLSLQAEEEAEIGAMTVPEPVDLNNVASKSYSRRIPLRELRSKGWRRRSVDHYTEGGMNGTSQ